MPKDALLRALRTLVLAARYRPAPDDLEDKLFCYNLDCGKLVAYFALQFRSV